ncbi:hypothetical protein GOQ30_18100 [Flavobacterium sp. TP390]|uniref:Uncharacterized protein n=1 Tax=Flavobacterium profundi TaxID=1774945 RepID=A0A6I4IVV7_9FLAO|nr:hypothetical protein [Flavobacterium profundi]MVO11087.1 hypothetical protein [Flavobacterium profundi]
MKLLIYISFIFFSILSFAQQTYKVTEGELQYIIQGKGIIIKKESQLYLLRINVSIQNKKQNVETKLILLTEETLKTYSQINKTISYNEIDENYDFDLLKNISFNYIEKFSSKELNYEEYKLCKVNNNFFAKFRDEYDDKNVYTNIEDYMPYIFIKFNNKKVIYTFDNEELFIIPTKKSFEILSLHNNYDINYKTVKLKLTNSEIYYFSQHIFNDLEEDFFRIDTLENKKVKLKNIYNETLINQSYDSIKLSKIIKCYIKGKIDLYNLSYKKLNKFPLQASKGSLGSIQILENNKLKWRDWTGKKLKKRFSFPLVLLPEAPQQDYKYELTISKSHEKFILKIRNFNVFGFQTNDTETDTLSLSNTFGIKNFYFQSNNSKDTILSNSEFYHFDNYVTRISEMVDFSYTVVYFQRENGTFGMSYLGNFFVSNEDFKNNITYKKLNNFNEYQDLQFVEFKYPFYKMKKNNLFKLFPLHKEFRYKKLEDFEGNFARFKLPNCQKGWLSLDGIEYLDE